MKTKITIISAFIYAVIHSSFTYKTIIGGTLTYSVTHNEAKAQLPSYGSGGSTVDTSWAIFEVPVTVPRYEVVKIKRQSMHVKAKSLVLDSMINGNFPIVNDKYVWMDQTTGVIKASKRDTLLKMLNDNLSFLSNTVTVPAQVNIIGGGINSISGSYPNITVTGTEVDGSITNEIQTLSGSGTQTIALSSGGTFVIPTQTVVTTIIGNNDITVTSAYPGFSLTPYVPSANAATRATNSTTFQVSSTRNAWVAYTIRINCTATIGSASSGTVALQYSTNNGSSWIDVSQLENSNTVSLAIVLNSNTTQTSVLYGFIPFGTIQRIVTTTAGTTTVTFVRGQETY
jgi:hypothetical protein